MSIKEDQLQINDNGLNSQGLCSAIKSKDVVTYQTPRDSTDKEGGLPNCRVCQCSESDSKGDAALGYLNIIPPIQPDSNEEKIQDVLTCVESGRRKSGVIEFVNTDGEVFICTTDIEMGFYNHQDVVIQLGCSCKNDLALAHYACALKWFINHGSTVCEICGSLAKNIRLCDFKKIIASLKEYDSLKEGTFSGQPMLANTETNSAVDPNATTSIQRRRLHEISLWFNPHPNNTRTTSRTVTQGGSGQNSNVLIEDFFPSESPATKWAVEGTGILVATGLLTVTLAWLIAPRVGKKIAKSGLHILLGGICALTVVLFLRFIVLSRIKYGPARYWAILFVFWFLVFGIWASRTHGEHPT
ncbi:hypothetical protein ACHQM5_016482 [Ranunculus cassubicifolius]